MKKLICFLIVLLLLVGCNFYSKNRFSKLFILDESTIRESIDSQSKYKITKAQTLNDKCNIEFATKNSETIIYFKLYTHSPKVIDKVCGPTLTRLSNGNIVLVDELDTIFESFYNNEGLNIDNKFFSILRDSKEIKENSIIFTNKKYFE